MWLYDNHPDAATGMLMLIYGTFSPDLFDGRCIFDREHSLFTVASKYDVPTLINETTKAMKGWFGIIVSPNSRTGRGLPKIIHKIYDELPLEPRVPRDVAANQCSNS